MTAHGHCDPAFREVQDIFEATLDGGAGLAVFVGGTPVVDLWGGVADARTGREWDRDTPCIAFSCTKAITTTAALLLAERGAVDLDRPVTDWWPEYGTNGKAATTATHFLTHAAGLPAFDRTVAGEEAADAAAMAAQLAGQTPEWEPGTRHGYHALTFGWLAGEIVRRLSGRTVGEYVRAEFAPDLWIGASPEVIERAARFRYREPSGADKPLPLELLRATTNPVGSFNKPVVLAGGWPGAGMVTTARDLADFYRRLIDGSILGEDTLRHAVKERVRGLDPILDRESAFGLGYMLTSETCPMPATAFGHPGAGGSLGIGDTEHEVAVAFIPNVGIADMGADHRATSLVRAVYAAL